MRKTKKAVGGGNSLLVLESLYPSLTKTERKVADAIRSDPEGILYATLTDAAERAKVGETSVLRLCRKLGFSGYQDFKLALAQDLVNPVKNVHSEIEADDDAGSIARKITQENMKALEDTARLLDEGELKQAIEAIIRADRLYFFGIGSSGITAMDGKYRFMRLGFRGEAITDSHGMAMAAALMTDRDVVLGVSTSGSTRDLVHAIRLAKENNAFFICLTSQARSPVTKYADAILLARSREAPQQGGAFPSKIAQIHVLDILSAAVAVRCGARAYKTLEQTSKAVADKLF